MIYLLRVVYYARVSTEEEKQLNALQIQCLELEEYIAKQNGWKLVDKYIDEGKTGTSTKTRKDFLRLLKDMSADKFDVVVIKLIERGWRNSYDWKLFERELVITKKQLFLKMRGSFYDFYNDSDYMVTNMEAQFAEWFSRQQSKKMSDAHKTRMEKGLSVVTNGKLWGYKQVDGRLEINEKEAEIVRYVFQRYIARVGLRTIAKELEAKGIRSRNGTLFSRSTLRRMIHQEKYKGMLICGKRKLNFFTKEYEPVPESEWYIHDVSDLVPVIVDPEIWDKANEILAEKRKEIDVDEKVKIAGYFNGSYPLSGKIKCSKCGNTYFHAKYTTMINPVWECKSYREHGKKGEFGCDNTRIPVPEMDAIVKEAIFNFWQNKEQSIKRVIAILDKVLEENDNKAEIKKLQNQIAKLEQRKKNLTEDRADRIITKEAYMEAVAEADTQLRVIQEELSKIDTNKVFSEKRKRLLEITEVLSVRLESKEDITDEMVRNLVQEIVVHPENKIAVTLVGDFSFMKDYVPQKRGRKKKESVESIANNNTVDDINNISGCVQSWTG